MALSSSKAMAYIGWDCSTRGIRNAARACPLALAKQASARCQPKGSGIDVQRLSNFPLIRRSVRRIAERNQSPRRIIGHPKRGCRTDREHLSGAFSPDSEALTFYCHNPVLLVKDLP